MCPEANDSKCLNAEEFERATRRPRASAAALLPTRDEYGWPAMLPILTPDDFQDSRLCHWLGALFPLPKEMRTYQEVTRYRVERILGETAARQFHSCLNLSPADALTAAGKDPELAASVWNSSLPLLGYSGTAWYMEA